MKLKLKQMKMPMGKKSDAEDMKKSLMEGSPEEESSESPEEASAEGDDMSSLPEPMHGDEAPADASKLESVSDDDLMAEIKKRGLLSQLEHGDQSQGYDAESESNPENVS